MPTVYANALLATLNSRRAIRDVGLSKKDDSKASKSLFFIPLSLLSRSKNEKTEESVLQIGQILKEIPEDSSADTTSKPDAAHREAEGDRSSNDSRV